MRFKLLCLFMFFYGMTYTQDLSENQKYLLIRADDIGSSHAANVACIECYRNGIVRSVELMVPCGWFPEAVKMLNENPGLDVGVHLVLTSEWDNMKWRPLTPAGNLVDEAGFFYPMVWQREDFPPRTSIQSSDWKIEEIEKELIAQIELGALGNAGDEANGIEAHHLCVDEIAAQVVRVVRQLEADGAAVARMGATQVDPFAVEPECAGLKAEIAKTTPRRVFVNGVTRAQANRDAIQERIVQLP